MSFDHSDFVSKIGEISALYLEVKGIMILAENLDKEKDAYIAPINELRNTLDHILRSFQYPEKLETEFSEAKEHLYRAGYDAYEILAINLGQKIVASIKDYPTDVITSIFPEFHHKIKPLLTDIQVELADTRAHKKLDPETGLKSFSIYKEKLDVLVDISKKVDVMVNDLEEEVGKRKKQKEADGKSARKQKWKERGYGFLVALIIAILGQLVFKYFYDRKLAPAKTEVQSDSTNSTKNK